MKVIRNEDFDDCSKTGSNINASSSQLDTLKKDNQRLQEENIQLKEKNNRFPDLLAVWRSRYEEAMNKNLSKVLMHSGDVFIPMGVHLREMKTVDTWKKRFENEQKLRKELEGYIEKWKKNNNQLRKELEIEEKAHKRTKKMLEMFMPESSGNQSTRLEVKDEKKESLTWPVPLDEIKQEEPSTSTDELNATPNEILTKLIYFNRDNIR
uniref:Uncharacterized protein n=1 Tax=Caenorhabditis tropicalis TaxID=1561998 RepID=A0A1I7T096_9PELO